MIKLFAFFALTICYSSLKAAEKIKTRPFLNLDYALSDKTNQIAIGLGVEKRISTFIGLEPYAFLGLGFDGKQSRKETSLSEYNLTFYGFELNPKFHLSGEDATNELVAGIELGYLKANAFLPETTENPSQTFHTKFDPIYGFNVGFRLNGEESPGSAELLIAIRRTTWESTLWEMTNENNESGKPSWCLGFQVRYYF